MRRIAPTATTTFRRHGCPGEHVPRSPVWGRQQRGSWRGRMAPGGAAGGGPARDPGVEAVCAYQGQLATCAADGESHMVSGARLAEMEDPTRRADVGAAPPTTTVPTRPGDVDVGGG